MFKMVTICDCRQDTQNNEDGNIIIQYLSKPANQITKSKSNNVAFYSFFSLCNRKGGCIKSNRIIKYSQNVSVTFHMQKQ